MLSLFLLAVFAAAVAWTICFLTLRRALRRCEAAPHASLFGTTARRKNGVDQFFAILGFVLQGGHRRVADRRVRLGGFGLKLFAALFLACFLAMMFAPFLVRK